MTLNPSGVADRDSTSVARIWVDRASSFLYLIQSNSPASIRQRSLAQVADAIHPGKSSASLLSKAEPFEPYTKLPQRIRTLEVLKIHGQSQSFGSCGEKIEKVRESAPTIHQGLHISGDSLEMHTPGRLPTLVPIDLWQ